MRIFVTGASGFVGGATVRRLVADGHVVLAMSRSETSDEKLAALGVQPVRCDLDGVTAAHLDAAEAVVHAAAYVEPWGPRDAWFRANVLGTQKMLDAARAAHVRRFVHIGTEAAIVFGQHLRGADESEPLALQSPYPYCATKAEAERRVIEADAPGFTTLVLRPRFVWGPGDQTILPMLEDMAARRRFRWIDRGRALTSTTYIDNLVHAVVLALSHGRGGQSYFVLDDGERTMRDMLTALAATRGIQLPTGSVPSWLAGAAAATLETVWRLFDLDGAPPLTRHAVMVMSRDCTLSDAKARRELGYHPPVGVEAGLAALSRTAPSLVTGTVTRK
jgi:nucleoside-diphosphate-sugar epimerase